MKSPSTISPGDIDPYFLPGPLYKTMGSVAYKPAELSASELLPGFHNVPGTNFTQGEPGRMGFTQGPPGFQCTGGTEFNHGPSVIGAQGNDVHQDLGLVSAPVGLPGFNNVPGIKYTQKQCLPGTKKLTQGSSVSKYAPGNTGYQDVGQASIPVEQFGFNHVPRDMYTPGRPAMECSPGIGLTHGQSVMECSQRNGEYQHADLALALVGPPGFNDAPGNKHAWKQPGHKCSRGTGLTQGPSGIKCSPRNSGYQHAGQVSALVGPPPGFNNAPGTKYTLGQLEYKCSPGTGFTQEPPGFRCTPETDCTKGQSVYMNIPGAEHTQVPAAFKQAPGAEYTRLNRKQMGVKKGIIHSQDLQADAVVARLPIIFEVSQYSLPIKFFIIVGRI